MNKEDKELECKSRAFQKIGPISCYLGFQLGPNAKTYEITLEKIEYQGEVL